MFFTNSLFTFESRQDSAGMGVVWIAATVGGSASSSASFQTPGFNVNTARNNSIRKLSKKDVTRVDLTRICKYLTNPPEPMALRLSSNLMFGATRVLGNQVHFLYSDAASVSARLKKVFSDAATGASISMSTAEISAAAITLDLGDDENLLADETYIDPSDRKKQALGWFISRKNAATAPSQSSVSAAASIHSTISNQHAGSAHLFDTAASDTDLISLPQALIPSAHAASHRSSNASISIPAAYSANSSAVHSLGSALLDFSALEDAIAAPGAALGSVHRETGGTGERYVGEDLDFDFGGHVDAVVDAVLAEDHAGVARAAPRGRGYVDLGMDFDINALSGGDQFNFHELAPAAEDAFNGIARLGLDAEGFEKNIRESEATQDSVPAKVPKRKYRKMKKVHIDDRVKMFLCLYLWILSYPDQIQLTNEEMGGMRPNATAALDIAQRDAHQKVYNAHMDKFVKSSLNGFQFCYGPVLQVFLAQFRGTHSKLLLLTKRFLPTLCALTDEPADEIDDASIEVAIAKPGKPTKKRKLARSAASHDEDPIEEPDAEDFLRQRNADNGFFDFSAGLDAIDFPTRNDLGSFGAGDVEAIEAGVAAAESRSASRVSLPWSSNRGSRRRMTSLAGSQRLSGRGVGSAVGSLLMSDGPSGGEMLRDASERSSLANEGFSSGGGAGVGEGSGDELLFDSLNSGSILFQNTAETVTHGAEESHAFLDFAKSRARTQRTPHVHLNDLVGSLNSRAASSQAFYHVLYLLTNREISASQAVPFGDIKILFSDDRDESDVDASVDDSDGSALGTLRDDLDMSSVSEF
ncbi:Rec8 like protein-domain-containing protein [Chytriomyces sp. MP71]|nr:Rec8 like protein-domain-containing protein [Chytriomyces sp. MP71]